ncbi:sprT-like domain-containing protein Spartan isoform X2 [Electrophorus electricus]|uniref:sprT-like domain-containing protein Spartan isoform X2 n=1 Tax=Electrophorus electricus TaxID=8005 RepID=UPI0015D05008|nr:sprT-like domain-containing protein Spartan isoform X2 [Electrophorus electricus]
MEDDDDDFLLALRLQEQFDREAGDGGSPARDAARPPETLSVVDERWETLDPNPDVRAMFLRFNDAFFWGKLGGVEVKWSPRMTLCAGVCSYEGRGGLCSIRLSEPLLKLRPRRDLVQTLLHEMIHALLFVTQNNRDRDGHGPEFCKHMNRINQASGANITIYHSFHDEVDVYRQHWWRCNGPCRSRRPFLGYVKRAMNRPPSAQDPWWEDHRRTCGGTYVKIKEPENYRKKGKREEKKEQNPSRKPEGKNEPTGNAAGSGCQDIRSIVPFSGRGFVLGGSAQTPRSQSPTRPLIAVQDSDKTFPANLEPRPGPTQTGLPPELGPTRSDPTPWPCPTRSKWRVSAGIATALPKRSVGNTKAFVNIDGSPKRITKANGSLARPVQRTVQDLFQAQSLNSAQKAASRINALKPTAIPNHVSSEPTSSAKPIGQPCISTDPTKANPFCSSHNSVGHKPAPTGPLLSIYFGSPKHSAGGVPGPTSADPGSQRKPEGSSSECFGSPEKSASRYSVSPPGVSGNPPRAGGTAVSGGRKRTWEEHSSARIFDFFQRAASQSLGSPGERREEGPAAGAPSAGRPGAGRGPLSSTALTVCCPACRSRVPESQINEHLDSCLE